MTKDEEDEAKKSMAATEKAPNGQNEADKQNSNTKVKQQLDSSQEANCDQQEDINQQEADESCRPPLEEGNDGHGLDETMSNERGDEEQNESFKGELSKPTGANHNHHQSSPPQSRRHHQRHHNNNNSNQNKNTNTTTNMDNNHHQHHQQLPPAAALVSADYLAQLIKDKKQLGSFAPNVFIHVPRLIDDEINNVRQQLFQLNDVVRMNEPPLELPEPEGELVQLQEKLYVPVDEHPEYNFVGRLLGPRGMTAKQLELETGCKIMIRGRGSMRDKKKEEQNRGKANWEHLNDDLHVLITVEDTQNRAQVKLKRALEEVKQLLVPIVDGEDELKKRQLIELAIINGTYRDCNYNETLSKMLDEAAYRQSVAPGPSPADSSSGHHQHAQQHHHQQHHHHQTHHSHHHHLQQQQQQLIAAAAASMANVEVGAGQHQAQQLHQQQPGGARHFAPSHYVHQQQHQHQHTSSSVNGSSGVPSSGSDTPNSMHNNNQKHLQQLSGSPTAAAMAAAMQQHHQQHSQHVHLNNGHHQHVQLAGPPPPPPPPTSLHHPQSPAAAAAAAAAAALMSACPPDARALMYAQQYHDFQQHYAAMAAAAAAAAASQQQPHAPSVPQPSDFHVHQQQHQAAMVQSVAAAAAAAAHQMQQQQHHHHHHQHNQYHHLHHQQQQVEATPSPGQQDNQQQQQQQLHQVANYDLQANSTTGQPVENGNDDSEQQLHSSPMTNQNHVASQQQEQQAFS